MSTSALTETEKGLPESLDSGNEAVTKNPYAGTLLGEYSDAMRAEILRSLAADENADHEVTEPTPQAEYVSQPFTLDTYSPAMRAEILGRYEQDFDDAVYPTIQQKPSEIEQEEAACLRAYLGSMGRNRRDAA